MSTASDLSAAGASGPRAAGASTPDDAMPDDRAGDDAAALAVLAVDVARAAGVLLLEQAAALRAGADLGVGLKSSATDPVSNADRAAEQLVGERLAAARPDDGLLGEEGGLARPSTSGRTWVVDPLDGTVNFLYGIPSWCVSVACVDADGALVGVVHDPNRDETFVAWRGGGAHLGERRLRCTEVADPTRALVATGFSYDRDARRDWGAEVARLLGEVRDVRRGGSAALDLAWCAAGRLDGYLELGIKPWDWAAGRLLVEEAGGIVSDVHGWLGGERRHGLVTGGRATHDHLAALLRAGVAADGDGHAPA